MVSILVRPDGTTTATSTNLSNNAAASVGEAACADNCDPMMSASAAVSEAAHPKDVRAPKDIRVVLRGEQAVGVGLGSIITGTGCDPFCGLVWLATDGCVDCIARTHARTPVNRVRLVLCTSAAV